MLTIRGIGYETFARFIFSAPAALKMISKSSFTPVNSSFSIIFSWLGRKLFFVQRPRYAKFFVLALIVVLYLPNVALADGLPNFTKLVDKYGPAIVNISTTQKIKHPKIQNPHGLPSMPNMPEGPFGDLFRHFFEDKNGKKREFQEFKNASLGSGFIISRDGYVLTNHHVIKDAEEVIVRLSDRRELTAKVVGSDRKSDIALLKIDADDLPVVKLNRRSDVKVGEWVLAIGSPFGFEATVTAGIVSATGRSLPQDNYVPFIQTDVAINPGNSGGPLFDVDGNVIGVNSQIFSRTGGFMGLSFAIPIDVAMGVVDQIKDKGFVSRGWLGVLIQDVTRELAESMNMARPEGALVSKVLSNSPAEKAGLVVGDVIVEFNGQALSRSSSLPPLVGMTTVGSTTKVKVIRNGKTVTLKVVLGELPSDEAGVEVSSTPSMTAGGRLKLQVTDLSSDQRIRAGVDFGGVYVASVESGPGKKAGIRRGDIVLMLNNEEINNVAHFSELEDGLPSGKSIRILVQRGKAPLFLAAKLD